MTGIVHTNMALLILIGLNEAVRKSKQPSRLRRVAHRFDAASHSLSNGSRARCQLLVWLGQTLLDTPCMPMVVGSFKAKIDVRTFHCHTIPSWRSSGTPYGKAS